MTFLKTFSVEIPADSMLEIVESMLRSNDSRSFAVTVNFAHKNRRRILQKSGPHGFVIWGRNEYDCKSINKETFLKALPDGNQLVKVDIGAYTN